MGLLDLLRRRRPDEDEPYSYPLERTQDRVYPEDFEGDVYIWDIDKTYLSTEFDSLRGLLLIPLEGGVDKRNVAATDVLLRALRRGPSTDDRFVSNPLYFVSASPPQLRSVIQRKMLLDGVEFDGITFKDHMALIRAGRMAKVTEQIGYKLSALLLNRLEIPWTVRETLFGDDSEQDALTYALYADVVAGRLRGEALIRSLVKNGVELQDADYIADLAREMPHADVVHRIYINLEHRTPPARFHEHGGRVLPCWDTFQMALHLYQDGKVSREAVLDVARELLAQYQRQPLGLLRNAFDLVERGRLRLTTLRELWGELQTRHLVPDYAAIVDHAEAPEPAPMIEEPPSEFVTPTARLTLH
ncbi:MAG: hypothetical protein ACQEXJ_15350 [Myxococcota bacterium]